VFLGGAGVSLCSAMQSRMLSLDKPGAVEGGPNHLAALDTSGLVEALGQRLHLTASIGLRKLLLLQRSLRWAAVSFLGWTTILIMSVAM